MKHLRLTRDAIKGKDVVHEGSGEDYFIVNWYAAPNQPSVSSLRVYRQVMTVAVSIGEEIIEPPDQALNTQLISI